MGENLDLTERTLGREDKFKGRILTVHVDTVELPGGRTATREVADHPGGVAVLALDGDNCVLAVTQYRYPFGRTLLEIPAGKLDHPGEDPCAAGLRELREETGAVPGRYESLGRILPSPGCYGETLHLYLARDLRMAEQHLDEDEFLNVERIPFGEMARRCLSGEIEDAKTVAAVLKAKILLNL
ncbi:MAG: NUDIX hydrolase [Dysosmobacter sp.]|nr:NUDIX hydrolase [Dysosmobacter sp.]